ncbi:tol-pal system-associated acyl-CoA thioesterase [Coralloluteibacterium stylophorae]|uniref:Tol-pal system-associated acyl-CoA thioesterase n=1 Tax=Coralloluteibacterium stylophorae TaxID=1776034 RepID=A0AAP2C9J3_9GAMM|nr:tol-pal system-associated acyl-CoA thioesterase [Coralloluteibacterium stylophorae]MBS7456776.1 tol-pal system-associated acyl-CoA thioesterase [Coralloluteibacterium stylophorae]
MFSFPTRVYWEDTDAGGVVYHASYVRFFERARTEWLRGLGFGQRELGEREDLLLVVRGMRLEFLRPARLDDLLEVSVLPVSRRGASLVIRQEIRRGEERLTEAEVRVASINRNFRPRALPDWLVAQIDSPGATG